MAAVMALILIYAAAVVHAVWVIRRHPASPRAKFVLFLLSLFTAGLLLERLPRSKQNQGW